MSWNPVVCDVQFSTFQYCRIYRSFYTLSFYGVLFKLCKVCHPYEVTIASCNSFVKLYLRIISVSGGQSVAISNTCLEDELSLANSRCILRGFEDSSPPVNAKQLGVCDLGTEFGFVSIQFFQFFWGEMNPSLLKRAAWHLTPFILQIWLPESCRCDFLRALSSSIIQSHPQLMFQFFIQWNCQLEVV